jgi:hypothetical protein|tara:strand:+ start:12848 stop:13069 length:222 start_codon:yes stop_codon:yes gene_type:complete
MDLLSNYRIAENIMNTKEYLTKAEYDFCFAHTDDVKLDTSYIGDYSKYGDYLNLRLYSEHEHHEAQLQMEIGC